MLSMAITTTVLTMPLILEGGVRGLGVCITREGGANIKWLTTQHMQYYNKWLTPAKEYRDGAGLAGLLRGFLKQKNYHITRNL